MQYKVKNVTLNIDCIDGDFTGDCMVYIPFSHKEFFKDYCGMEKYSRKDEYDPIFDSSLGEVYVNKDLKHYYTNNADILIAYLSYLFKQDGQQEVEVNYSNPFWAIHDVEHALNDENFCVIHVTEKIEKERLQDTFVIMNKEGFDISYELCQEVSEAFNGRFNTNYCFWEYCMENGWFDEELAY